MTTEGKTNQPSFSPQTRLDSSELERVVNELATARSELETILANAWIGVVQVNAQRIITRVNRHFEQDIFGYEAGEMVGHYSSILYPSVEDYETIGRQAYPALVSGKPFSMLECTCRRKDGTNFLAQLVGSLTDPTDYKKGSIWLFSDITEQKAAEERLQHTLSELEIIFQNPNVGVAYTIDRQIIRTNRTLEKILNRRCDELIGQSTRFLYESEAAYAAAGEKIEAAFAVGASCRLDICTRGKDDQLHTYELHGSIVDIEDPQKRAIWLFTDVTEIRRMQDKLREAQEATERAAAEIREKNEQIASLLDNSGQGFLLFGPDLISKPVFSRACLAMLGESPAGRDVSELFFLADEAMADFFRATIAAVMVHPDAEIRLSMLSLLPAEIRRHELILKVEYKYLDPENLMVVLTDKTAERLMAAQLEQEQRRQEMIVKSVSDCHNFFDAIEGFKTFLDQTLPQALSSNAPISVLINELYRDIHTFKGLFNQFSFPELPRLLHAAESELSHLLTYGTEPDRDVIDSAIACQQLKAQFFNDIEILTEALGADFMARGESVNLSLTQAHQLQHLAQQLLRGNWCEAELAQMRGLLEDLGTLGKLSLTSALLGFNRLVAQVAERLEKKVNPLIVTSSLEVFLDPPTYQPFIRALSHVFRNALAHGIETPEKRWEEEKGEAGTITCHLARQDEGILLTIEDDGAGIDVNALRSRLLDTGMFSLEQMAAFSDFDLLQTIFLDRISTQQGVSEVAGRGVGLSAVRRQTMALGGTVVVSSERGRGTRFVFSLPFTAHMIVRE